MGKPRNVDEGPSPNPALWIVWGFVLVVFVGSAVGFMVRTGAWALVLAALFLIFSVTLVRRFIESLGRVRRGRG